MAIPSLARSPQLARAWPIGEGGAYWRKRGRALDNAHFLKTESEKAIAETALANKLHETKESC